MMIPFSPPRIDQPIIDEVIATLKSGWITTGPRTRLFEQRLCEYNGNPATVCLNSATAGLEIMLRWFGVGPGDEVIVPAYTYCATANVVLHCGAKPVMVDIRNDFTIDTGQVRRAITGRTKAIIPVDFGGIPCDYDSLIEIVGSPAVRELFVAAGAQQKKLGRILILADSAHALGAVYHGKRTGVLADATVFSFHAVKNLTTAEGGAVALNLPPPFDNQEIFKALCVSILHGQDKDALAKTKRGNWRYDVSEAGFKCNMTDISAAIGLVELERYESDTLKKRKWICGKYNEFFRDKPWAELAVLTNENYKSSYHLFPLRIKGITEQVRDEIIDRIFGSGVSVNVHFIPLPLLSLYRNMGYRMDDYPVSFDCFSREISLPVFYDLTLEQIQRVVKAVSKAVDEAVLSSHPA
jgi:dTDP-4-amino-4,6-dideoxygalactose transaminase